MDEGLAKFNNKLLEVTNYDQQFFDEYSKFLDDEVEKTRFSFRFNQYLKILERDIKSEKTEKETLKKVNKMMSQDKVMQKTFGDNVSLFFDDSIDSEDNKIITDNANEVSDYNYDYEGAGLDAPFCLYI
jgi:hypothetical protein